MKTATVDTADMAPCASGAGRPESSAPGAAIRWQASFYRSYLANALQRLATDPNPDVQRIGHEMHQCLNCPSTERCVNCPFSRSAMGTVRGLGGGAIR